MRLSYIRLVNEAIYGQNRTATVFHRTKDISSVSGILSTGFMPGRGKMYGSGLYTTFDIESQLSHNMSIYGPYIVKFIVKDLDQYLVFDPEEAKKIHKGNWELNDQLKKFGIESPKKYSMNTNGFSSDLALKLYKDVGGEQEVMGKVKGIIFRGHNDNNVLVKFDPVDDGTITMSAYTYCPINNPDEVPSPDELKWEKSSSKASLKSIYGLEFGAKRSFLSDTDWVNISPEDAYKYANDIIKKRSYHTEPIIMRDPKYAYLYALTVIKGQWPKAEKYIIQDPYQAYLYARNVIKGQWPDAEPIIMRDPKLAYNYAKDVKRARWFEAEPIIMREPILAYNYAKNIINGRWTEIEPSIMKDPNLAYSYARDVIKNRWPEIEPSIMKDPSLAYNYARDVIKNRWPEAESTIMRDHSLAYSYARDVIKNRWPEIEPVIIKNPGLAYNYARDVIKGRWPEAEPIIMRDPKVPLYYVRDVIKGRWPEAESIIMQNPNMANAYRDILRDIQKEKTQLPGNNRAEDTVSKSRSYAPSWLRRFLP